MIVNIIYLLLIYNVISDDPLNRYQSQSNYTEYTDNTKLCNTRECEIENGYCYAEYTCRCRPNYISFNINTLSAGHDDNNKLCTYKQIHQSLATAMELLIPTLGHFYSNRYLYAGIKLIFTILPLTLALINIRYVRIKSKLFFLNLSCFCCVLFVWQIVDFIVFQNSGFTDGNGAPFDTR